MSENTNIQWTTHTFNGWLGCLEVSAGCDHCYARELATNRMGLDVWGKDKPRKRTGAANWMQPIRWNKEAGPKSEPTFVFCASMADVFEDGTWKHDIDDESESPKSLDVLRTELFALIRKTPNLTWQLLTKRPGNILRMTDNLRALPSNVWLGFSAEDQPNLDARLRAITAIRKAGWNGIVFISAGPLLGPLNLRYATHFKPALVDWIIVEGESGHDARPFDPEWALQIITQGMQDGVPVFVKQLGEVWARENRPMTQGKNGPVLDRHGGSMDKWPEWVKVREMPRTRTIQIDN